jgi:hypothetical protein
MRGLIYYATAPIRLFGRSRAFRLMLGAALVLVMARGLPWFAD